MAKIFDKMRNFFGGDDYDDEYDDEYDDYETPSYKAEKESMDYAPSSRTASSPSAPRMSSRRNSISIGNINLLLFICYY